MDEIKKAIKGDPMMGTEGIVPQLVDHECRIARIERRIVYLLGGIAMIVVAYQVLIDYLKLAH
jgi:hypothetical protein